VDHLLHNHCFCMCAQLFVRIILSLYCAHASMVQCYKYVSVWLLLRLGVRAVVYVAFVRLCNVE
jgi:hypothetical protein